MIAKTFATIKGGEKIVADPVMGYEEVVSIDHLSISQWGEQGKDHLVHVGLRRSDETGVRFIARVPHEPVLALDESPA